MKTNKRTYLFYESILVIFIVISPYLLYLHLNIPEELDKYDTAFGTIRSGYFTSIRIYVYWFFSKLVPLLLLIILYLTHKRWWSHALIIPISTYLFQLISVINDSEEFMGEIEYIYIIPIMVIVIVPLFILRNNISTYIEATDLKKEMDDKIGRVN